MKNELIPIKQLESDIESAIDEAIKSVFMEARIRDVLASKTAPELALGFLRYEALRTLQPRHHAELWKRNLKGENFDGMVDKVIISGMVRE